MKKVAAVVVITIIMVVVVMLVRGAAREIPFADVFPAGAIGYLGVRGGAELVDDLIGSNAWKKLNGVESVRDFTREARATIERGGAPVPALRTFSALLGEHAAAAIYGRESRFGRSILAAVKTREKGEAILALVTSGFGGKAVGSYRERELYSFRIPALVGLEGVYARGGDTSIAVVSQSDPMGLLKAAIDLSARKGGSPLSGDKQFKAGLGAPPRGAGTLIGCAYLDMKAIENEFQGLGAAIATRMRERNSAAADAVARVGMGRFPCMSWGGYLYRHQGLVGKLHTRLDAARLSAEQRALFDGGSGKLDLLRYVPAGAIAVSASRLGNIRTAWKWYRAQAGPSQPMNILSLCEKRFGINFERDVLPWMGEEMSLQLSDVVAGGLLPVVRLELILSVRDKDAADKTLTALMGRIAKPPATQTTQQSWAFLRPEISCEEYKGEKIKTLSYPIPGFSPSYALSDRYLIAGLDRSSVQAIIDVGAGARGALPSSGKFAEMRKVLPGRLNQLSYIDCERALGAGEGVVRWLLAVKKLMGTADNPEKAKEMEKVEADLPRIFAALRVFRAVMAGSTVMGDTIDSYFILRMSDI
ncbi:MAG: hypothetical protein NTX71_10315 [Candidatus Aureabacteria bacterium]|nr:hypothetical protein [Candidatus Auribacterota bacterium]